MKLSKALIIHFSIHMTDWSSTLDTDTASHLRKVCRHWNPSASIQNFYSLFSNETFKSFTAHDRLIFNFGHRSSKVCTEHSELLQNYIPPPNNLQDSSEISQKKLIKKIS